MRPRLRRRLRVTLLRGLRAARRHSVSLVSAAVLATAGTVALTNASFELPATSAGNNGAEVGATLAVAPGAAPTATQPPSATPTSPSRQVILYVVADRAQGDRLILTHNRLVWDNVIAEEYQSMVVRYVIAGTPETEANAIEVINYFIEIAGLREDDLRIIDLRAPAAAANRVSP